MSIIISLGLKGIIRIIESYSFKISIQSEIRFGRNVIV
jgi:hypothetical protein